MKILMVCLGNICRSPLAQAILNDKALMAGLNWQVDSAGTNGLHTDEAPHRLSQAVAWKNGLDISSQKSRTFIDDDFQKYDCIYVMAQDILPEIKCIAGKKYDGNKVKLLMNESSPGSNKNIPDPWYGPIDGYYKIYMMIEEACNAIIKNYLASIPSQNLLLKQSN